MSAVLNDTAPVSPNVAPGTVPAVLFPMPTRAADASCASAGGRLFCAVALDISDDESRFDSEILDLSDCSS